jgi:hypothetical protein
MPFRVILAHKMQHQSNPLPRPRKKGLASRASAGRSLVGRRQQQQAQRQITTTAVLLLVRGAGGS